MLEIADIFRAAGGAYRDRFAARMPPSHLKALRAIEACRTPALGGHLRQCTACGASQYTYHACRNRHCPTCHAEQTHRWRAQQRARRLPCLSCLVTFTLPAPRRAAAQAHQKLVYGILLTSAAQALRALTADPRSLGARPGLLAGLHPWTRALLYHPHAHCLVTAGGLTPDAQAWRCPRHRGCLVPGRALSVLFRAKGRDALDQAGRLPLVPPKAWRKRWVVHVKSAGTGQPVLDSLARSLFRVALANSRIETFQHGQVTFRYRESASGQLQRCRLPAEEFIRRFLQPVLPRGFTKVRAYGLYSPTCRAALERARGLLQRWQQATSAPDAPRDDTGDPPGESADPICPTCHHGRLLIVHAIPRAPVPPESSRDPPCWTGRVPPRFLPAQPSRRPGPRDGSRIPAPSRPPLPAPSPQPPARCRFLAARPLPLAPPTAPPSAAALAPEPSTAPSPLIEIPRPSLVARIEFNTAFCRGFARQKALLR